MAQVMRSCAQLFWKTRVVVCKSMPYTEQCWKRHGQLVSKSFCPSHRQIVPSSFFFLVILRVQISTLFCTSMTPTHLGGEVHC